MINSIEKFGKNSIIEFEIKATALNILTKILMSYKAYSSLEENSLTIFPKNLCLNVYEESMEENMPIICSAAPILE